MHVRSPRDMPIHIPLRGIGAFDYAEKAAVLTRSQWWRPTSKTGRSVLKKISSLGNHFGIFSVFSRIPEKRFSVFFRYFPVSQQNDSSRWLDLVPSIVQHLFIYCIIFWSSLLLSSSTRRRFYPQRSSGQAVVTGVVPSSPRYVPSFLSRIGFSIPTARRFSSNVANSRSRVFRYLVVIFFMQEKVPTSSYVRSVRIEIAKLTYFK